MVTPRTEGGNGGSAAPSLPRREDLEATAREVIKAGQWYKADVYAVDLGEGEMVIKDFARKPAWIRLIGRLQIGHECRAYEWLGRTPGVPVYYGRVDAHALAVERISGCELVNHPERFTGRRDFLHSLRLVIDHFLAAGFFHLDVRSRHNVMAQHNGQVMLLDLAGSWWVPPDSLRYRLARPLLLRFYRMILNKWRKLLTPGGRSYRDEKSPVSKLMMWLRMPHKLRRKLSKRQDPR
jgi:RIO-like serine/threonine protein kinase